MLGWYILSGWYLLRECDILGGVSSDRVVFYVGMLSSVER